MSELVENYHLVAIIGTNEIDIHQLASFLGKEGTKSDLHFYNRLEQKADGGDVWCVITPQGYPDKLKPVIQALRLTRIHVITLNLEEGISKPFGELIVALDQFGEQFQTSQIIAITGITPQNEYKLENTNQMISAILKNTTHMASKEIPVLEIRSLEDREKLKQMILSISNPPRELDFTKVLVDHSFPVKGIGTVILGLVESGEVTAGGMLELTGLKKKVIIRSIQKQDRDFKTAIPGDRVGLAIKGIKPEDVGRDDCLVSPGHITLVKKVQLAFRLNSFFDTPVTPQSTKQYHLVVNLATSPVKIVSGQEVAPGQEGTITLESEKPLPVDSEGTPGFLIYLEPFAGKLRVLGGGTVRAV